MIHNDIQNQLQLLIKTSAPPLIEVAEHATGTPQWTPGQRLPAHVLASLPNGRFEVKVGDQILDLNLPRNSQAGETLELTFISSSPRPTFALVRDLANALPANAPVSLSETAKFIGSLIQKSATAASAAAQAARATPVIDAPPASSADFAQSLRQAVSQSGLFYESHQVQWLRGERTLSTLLQEPQGRLSPAFGREGAPLPRAEAAGAEASQENAPAARPESMPVVARQKPPVIAWGRDMDTPAFRTTDAAGPLLAGTQPSEKTALEAIHPQSVQIVQQQLQTLDARQIAWQGQIWPGQEMTWEIEEDAARHGDAGPDDTASWHTTLSLHLPALGSVSAKLAFVNGTIQIDIATENPGSADVMRNAQAALADGFDSAGLQLTGVAIRHG